MKKIIAIILLLAMPLTIFVTGCDSEDEVARMILRDKIQYAEWMGFEFQIIKDGKPLRSYGASRLTDPMSPRFDPLYTEIVLVHNEYEAEGFPDNVIVAWPCEERTKGVIAGIHWAVNRTFNEPLDNSIGVTVLTEEITFEDFGLSYPLTLADLVDNWEEVYALWQSLSGVEQGRILEAAPFGGVIESEDLSYANRFWFNLRVVEDGVVHIDSGYKRPLSRTIRIRLNPHWPGNTESNTDIVFVHSEEEAARLPDDVVTAWPQPEFTENLIESIHWVVNSTPEERLGTRFSTFVTLEEFGLSYPLTVADFVDNREKVNALWQTFNVLEQIDLIRLADAISEEASPSEGAD